MIQEPLPALTYLDFVLRGSRIPDSFLGGSALQLRCLRFAGGSFLALPKLLLSATNLVALTLYIVPCFGYVSPDAMTNCLSALIRLERFELRFDVAESRTACYLEGRHPFFWTPAVLPALTSLDFKGMCIYLEDLVTQIDAVPLLCDLHIQFFRQPTFRTPRLSRVISRAPKLQALNEARVAIFGDSILVTVPSPTQQLASECSQWKFHAETGSLRLWRDSLPSPCPYFFRWNTSTWYFHCYGGEISRTPVTGTFTPIYRREESLLIREICATNRACPGRACQGKARKGSGGVTRSATYFLERVPAIGTSPPGHQTIC